MNLFGTKKKPPEPAAGPPPPAAPQQDGTKAAMAKVNETLENITKREDHVQRKIDLEMQNAMKFKKAGKQREAIQALKKKKMFDTQLETLAKTKMTLENQKLQMEAMNMNAEVLSAQKMAADAMQSQVKKMGGVDKVEELMDEIEDAGVSANEIQEAMGRTIDLPGVEGDDDELLAELDGMMDDELAGELTKVDLGAAGIGAADMPSAPISLPAAGTGKVMTDEEKELAELEAAMASG